VNRILNLSPLLSHISVPYHSISTLHRGRSLKHAVIARSKPPSSCRKSSEISETLIIGRWVRVIWSEEKMGVPFDSEMDRLAGIPCVHRLRRTRHQVRSEQICGGEIIGSTSSPSVLVHATQGTHLGVLSSVRTLIACPLLSILVDGAASNHPKTPPSIRQYMCRNTGLNASTCPPQLIEPEQRHFQCFAH
jgi:hypothetical protein